MKLYEHESADIFSAFGIRVPERILAATPDEAFLAAEKIGLPVVMKAQVLAGGRLYCRKICTRRQAHGHAGAIVRGSQGTFASKQQALRDANVTILNSPIDVIDWAKRIS